MAQVETMRGPIDASGLGGVLMHEHIFVRNPELEMNYPSPFWNEAEQVARARTMLMELKGLGINTLVDVTAMGLGRDIATLRKVADGLDFNIVVATGYYTYKDLPAFFRTHGPGLRIDVPEPLFAMFMGDISEGIAGTGIKAGIIKIATDDYGLTPDVERVFRAAARAHLETGVPITTHTSAKKKGGLDQQRLLKELAVDLRRVVIGHCGDTTDLDYLKTLMDEGSVVGMDRFGMENFMPTEDRIATVAALCAQGYADRMILSHDAAVFSINSEPEFRARWMPDWTYRFVPEKILPALARRGVTQSQLNQMMIETPRRLLGRL